MKRSGATTRRAAKTGRRKTPIQARSRATVEAILEATRSIIAEHDADAITTNRVAALAGVSVGSLYQYFPGKDALLVEVTEAALEAMTAACHEATPDGISEPEAAIRAFVERVVTAGEHALWLKVAHCVNQYGLESEARRALARARMAFGDFFDRLDVPMDRVAASRAVFAIFFSVGPYLQHALAQERPRDEVVEDAVRLAMGYLDQATGPPETS